jgi:hypothetical protein
MRDLPPGVDFTKLVAVCAPARSFQANESVRQLPAVSNFPVRMVRSAQRHVQPAIKIE